MGFRVVSAFPLCCPSDEAHPLGLLWDRDGIEYLEGGEERENVCKVKPLTEYIREVASSLPQSMCMLNQIRSAAIAKI